MKHLIGIFLILTSFSMVEAFEGHGGQEFQQPESSEVIDFINGIDLNEIETLLKGEGAVGWIHGAAAPYRQYVFTFRDPNNFFRFVNLSIATRSPKILKQLETMARHDLVRIKGSFSSNPSPQRHIKVESIELLKAFDPGMPFPKYHHVAELPKELGDEGTLTGKVHAVVAGGRIFVIEYKDAIIPLYVEATEHTANLWRNDVIELKYKRQEFPKLPVHLELDLSTAAPIRVTDSISEFHGKRTHFLPGMEIPAGVTAEEIQADLANAQGPQTYNYVEGKLVLFPKSPQLKFNVFALQVEDLNGIKRNFTLVNFQDIDVFMGVLEKLGDAWNAKLDGRVINSRNKLVNLDITIRVRGTFNVVDPNQANAQILLNAVEDIEVLP